MKLSELEQDPFTSTLDNSCLTSVFVNIRGYQCNNTDVPTWSNNSPWHLHIQSSTSGCSCSPWTTGAASGEDNFAYYNTRNTNHACSATDTSTANWWLGSQVVLTPNPTKLPTNLPSTIPTNVPTSIPTNIASNMPSNEPTDNPTSIPTILPSNLPTSDPTMEPIMEPITSNKPSNEPTQSSVQIIEPTSQPSNSNQQILSLNPTLYPNLSEFLASFCKQIYYININTKFHNANRLVFVYYLLTILILLIFHRN